MNDINFKFLIIFLIFLGYNAEAKDYYFHPKIGNDSANGTSFKSPFKSLVKISDLALEPGDRILLAAGEVFHETLILDHVQGSFENPILIDSYQNDGSDIKGKTIIDARGLLNGLLITNSNYIIIKNLDITANGPADDSGDGEMRVGVLIFGKGNERITNIHLEDLYIHDIFYEKEGVGRSEAEVRSANGTQKYGWGIRLIADDNAEIENIWISNSSIENVSHTGIKLTGTQRQNIRNVRILDNKVYRTGGPGIQMSGVKFVHVKGNEVSHSGSTDDSRKWGRGSGLWTWSASHVMIEHNSFMHANGPGDSAGAHIDFNCDNVILQYNFSAENAGGFCEILGNNYNCAYRYNISVNDGHRVKGENGAFQEGKVFWLSGFQGGQRERKGPVNSYFYNNTIYVKAGQVSKIAIDNRSKGVLIVNNIFHLEGPVEMVIGDQYKADESSSDNMERVLFENNLFLNGSNWPKDAMIHDASPLYGSAQFQNPGGMKPEDYIPANWELLQNGKAVQPLPDDEFGLIQGFKMKTDFLGNSISKTPGIGAIYMKYRDFQPGQLWEDDLGEHINAHGGGFLIHEDTYYWFGEHKTEGTEGNKAQVGVGVYSSNDLFNWKNEGIALKVHDDPNSLLVKGCIIERPKVIYNEKAKKFVMWFHHELKDRGYEAAMTGLAVSDHVTGPYTYIKSVNPHAGIWPSNYPDSLKSLPVDLDKYERPSEEWKEAVVNGVFLRRDFEKGQMARDMTLFVDDDGKAYHFHSSENNQTLHVAELTEDYMDFSGNYTRVLPGQQNEAPAIFKKDGKYYMFSSGLTGWKPNPGKSAVADHPMGPWTPLGNMVRGTEDEMKTTFRSQSTAAIPVIGKKDAFIYVGDRWEPENPIDGRYVWLPVEFEDERPVLRWRDNWDLSFFDN